MEPLFFQDLVVATLASGSRGNCSYIGDDRVGILVDCGLSASQILKRLDAVGLSGVRIDGIILTHEHKDHVGGARVLDNKLYARQGERVPFYLTAGTAMGLDVRCTPARMVQIRAGERFGISRFTVEPFAIPHDTREPIGTLVSMGDRTVGVLTDLGCFTEAITRQIARMDVGIIEFNHDLDRLMDGPYPQSLKARVRGPRGHLSNVQSAEMLALSAPDRLKYLLLAHLSEENNTPELAFDAAMRALHQIGRTDVQVGIARQERPIGPIRVRPLPRSIAPQHAGSKPAAPQNAAPQGDPQPGTRQLPPRQDAHRESAAPQPKQLGLFGAHAELTSRS